MTVCAAPRKPAALSLATPPGLSNCDAPQMPEDERSPKGIDNGPESALEAVPCWMLPRYRWGLNGPPQASSPRDLPGGRYRESSCLPCRVVSGHSELLAMVSPSDERWKESIAEIQRATELGSTSIRQLLAFSCQQILEPKVLDLNAVVSEAEKMLRRIIGEDVRLATVLQPRLSPVRADLGQLKQVILNLAVNARDAMPQGGSLTLETREVDLDEPDAKTHLVVRPGRYVLLTVTDTGWGMAPDVQARIFEPFFTNKAEGQGTGLGLSVVLGIIQQSGGYIDVESKPGVGTKFRIHLPAVQGVADGLVQSVRSQLIKGSETVLLVEDEEPVRNITTRLLETLGYRVLEAENGQDALRLFNVGREKIDLLLTDVVMPDMSGREVAEALQSLDPDLRVLFHSGYTDDTVVRRGILRAEVAFLKKPFTLDSLARKVREVLDRPMATG